jgi:hypothetical protein
VADRSGLPLTNTKERSDITLVNPEIPSSKIGDQRGVASDREGIALRSADDLPVVGPVDKGVASVG